MRISDVPPVLIVLEPPETMEKAREIIWFLWYLTLCEKLIEGGQR